MRRRGWRILVPAAAVAVGCAKFSEADPVVGSDGSVEAGPPPEAAASEAGVPPRFAQSNSAEEKDASTLAIVLPQPSQAGSTIIVAVASSVPDPIVTDEADDKFLARSKRDGNGRFVNILTAEGVRGGAQTITMKFGKPNRIEGYVHEYADVAMQSFLGAGAGVAPCDRFPGCMETSDIPAPARSMLFGFAFAGMVLAGDGFQARETLDSNVTEDRIVEQEGLVRAVAKKQSDGTFNVIFGVVLRGR